MKNFTSEAVAVIQMSYLQIKVNENIKILHFNKMDYSLNHQWILIKVG